MTSLKVLFVGGTGVISAACAASSIELGHELHLLTRTRSERRPAPAEAILHFADIHDSEAVDAAIGGLDFDVVVDFVAFETRHVQADIDRFRGRVGQFVFIGTTSSYQKPALRLPITESTPLRNPHFAYSRAKIECEGLLDNAYRDFGFPATIVRPSFTYDRTSFPISDGWAVVQRMRESKEVVVHGDGSALGTLTHASDFARTFALLLGNERTVGDDFHITSDEIVSWQQVYDAIASAAGIREPRYVHVPSDVIAEADPQWGETLLGDKTHSAFFDNTKVRSVVPQHTATMPYWRGARETVAWYDAHPESQTVDERRMATMDRLIERFRVSGT
jgi:nucleoside-diphosphate-sugar epimerase